MVVRAGGSDGAFWWLVSVAMMVVVLDGRCNRCSRSSFLRVLNVMLRIHDAEIRNQVHPSIPIAVRKLSSNRFNVINFSTTVRREKS